MKLQRWKYALKWSFTFLVVVLAVGFTEAGRKGMQCQKIEIDVERISGMYFIDENTVTERLFDLGLPILGTPLDSLPLQRMRASVLALPSVKEAEVYSSVDGILKVQVTQRKPLFRVFSKAGDSFYIDEEGMPMPLSTRYSAHVPVLSGAVRASFASEPDRVLEDSVIHQATQIVRYIQNDPFWHAQTEHMNVTEQGEFEIIPRVGSARILLGSTRDLEDKFTRLKVFYREMALKNDLNKYKRINVKYRDQVVCERYF